MLCHLDSPEVKLRDAHKAFAGVVEMNENLAFLRTARTILHSLDEIHSISRAEEAKNLDAMILRGTLRKLMYTGNGAACLIPFDNAGSQVSQIEMGYLGNFIATLDSINATYRLRYQNDIYFEIGIFGYTDNSGSEEQNRILATSRARNSAKILTALAHERNLKLKVIAVEGYPNQHPNGGENCQKDDDPNCRVCKIILTKMDVR